MVPLHNALRCVQHLSGGFRVQCRGVLVQQQQFRFLQRCHQQGQCLTLTAGQQTHLGGQPIFQTQIQNFQHFLVLFPLTLGDARAEGTFLTPAHGQCQIFLNLHGGSRTHHRVLKHAAHVFCPLVLRQLGYVLAADGDGALVHLPHTGYGVEQGGFTGAVAADDGAEITVVQMQGQTVQRGFFVNGTCVKGFVDILNVKHCSFPLSSQVLQKICSSSTALPGTQPPPRR